MRLSISASDVSTENEVKRLLMDLQDVIIQADDVRIAEDQVEVFESF